MEWLLKVFLFVVWPLIALVLFAFVGVLLVACWFMIPFSTLRQNKSGGYDLVFKENQK